ncbi:nucleotidyltransferase domain-containing protein [Chitinivorax tropicus]
MLIQNGWLSEQEKQNLTGWEARTQWLDQAAGKPLSIQERASVLVMLGSELGPGAKDLGVEVTKALGQAIGQVKDKVAGAGTPPPKVVVGGGLEGKSEQINASSLANSVAVGEKDSVVKFGSPRPGLVIPQGIIPSLFDKVSARIRGVASEKGLGDDIFVMGSRAGGTAKAGSDLDIGIRVSPEKFDELISTFFKNSQNAKAKTRDVSIRDGRIQTGESGLRGLRNEIASDLDMPKDKIQISIIRSGGVFDNGPQTKLSYDFEFGGN